MSFLNDDLFVPKAIALIILFSIYALCIKYGGEEVSFVCNDTICTYKEKSSGKKGIIQNIKIADIKFIELKKYKPMNIDSRRVNDTFYYPVITLKDKTQITLKKLERPNRKKSDFNCLFKQVSSCKIEKINWQKYYLTKKL